MSTPDFSEDEQLLTGWVSRGDQAAFQALARKYTALVYGAALRKTGRADWAEDIVQEVFVIFARRSPRLKGGGGLAGWLHRTAVLAAAARLRSELRRDARMKKLTGLACLHDEPPAGEVSERDWAVLRPVLDDALAELPDLDRRIILLHYFERKTFSEVASLAGLSHEAAKKRSLRALEKLGRLLRRRGAAVPATTLGGALLAAFGEAAPAALAAKTGAVGAAAVSAAGMVNAFTLSSLLVMKPAVIAAVLVITGGLFLAFRPHGSGQHAFASSQAPGSSSLSAQTGSAMPGPVNAEPDAAQIDQSPEPPVLPAAPSGPGAGIADIDPEVFRTHPETIRAEARVNALKGGFKKLLDRSSGKRENQTRFIADAERRSNDPRLTAAERTEAKARTGLMHSSLKWLADEEEKFKKEASAWLNSEVSLQRRRIIAAIKQEDGTGVKAVDNPGEADSPHSDSTAGFSRAHALMDGENYREALTAFNALAQETAGEARDQANWKAMLCAMVTGSGEEAAIAATQLVRDSSPSGVCFAMAAKAIQKNLWDDAQIWVDQAAESGSPEENAAFGEAMAGLGWKEPAGNRLIPPD